MRDPSSVELRHLRTFLTISETESFTRAAERLGISQPSISVQIRELETALGAQLFNRLGQRTTLTAAGRTFRERAALVLDKFSDACQSVQETEELLAGHISLAIIPLLTVPWIPRVLSRMAREHPGVAVTVTERSSDDLEIAVETGRCDLGVGILSHASPNLTYELMRTDELVLVQGPEGPFGKRRSVTAEEAGSARLAVLPRSYVIRQITDEAFRAARVLPRHLFELDSIDGVLATVVQSELCTFMPSVVLEGREHLDARALRLRGWGHSFEFGLIYPGATPAGSAVSTFAASLRQATRAKARRGAQRMRKSKSSRIR